MYHEWFFLIEEKVVLRPQDIQILEFLMNP